MKKIGYLLGSGTAFMLPVIALAAFSPTGGAFGTFLQNVLIFINNVLIPFIIGIGFLMFVWGMFQYFIAGGANDEAKEKGKSLMIWATLGFVLIIVFWGVINLLAESTGMSEDFDTNLIPNAPAFPSGGASTGP